MWDLRIGIDQALTCGSFDVAVRDVVLSIGAFTLARLIQVRDQFEIGARATTVEARVGTPADPVAQGRR